MSEFGHDYFYKDNRETVLHSAGYNDTGIILPIGNKECGHNGVEEQGSTPSLIKNFETNITGARSAPVHHFGLQRYATMTSINVLMTRSPTLGIAFLGDWIKLK